MILYEHANNTFIIKEITQQIDLEFLNKLINKLLHNRNELDQSSTVTRANRHFNFVIITCYASLSGKNLKEFIELFLNEFNHQYIINKISEEDLKVIEKYLPIISNRKNSQCGGNNDDSRLIDPNVLPLCNAINLYPGIKTFSSCEGHLLNKTETVFYVLFTNDTKEDLDKFTFALWNSLERTHESYPIIKHLQLLFDYGHWPNKKCTYFELRLSYKKGDQDLVFEAMYCLSSCLYIEMIY